MEKKEKRLLSLIETAEILDVPRETLYYWVRRKKITLRPKRIGPGRLIKFERTDIEEYLKSL